MDPETAAHYAKVGQATLIYATCVSSILWYDTLSTLPREFNLVWIPLYKKHLARRKKSQDAFQGMSSSSSSSPLSYISIFLFFTVRWVCNLQFILIVWSIWRVWTPKACDKWFYVDSYFSGVVTCAATGIMALRLSAIWGRNVRVDSLMLILWISLSAAVLWACYFITPVPGVSYCIAQQTPDHNLLALYIGPMVFDFIVLSLTVGRAVHLNHGNAMRGRILTLLIRDGILYFLGTFTVNLLVKFARHAILESFSATAFELQNVDPALKPINATLATVGTSILSSRIFFRMRELATRKTGAIPETFANGTNSNYQSKSYGSKDTSNTFGNKWGNMISTLASTKKSFSVSRNRNFDQSHDLKRSSSKNSIQIELNREISVVGLESMAMDERDSFSTSRRQADKDLSRADFAQGHYYENGLDSSNVEVVGDHHHHQNPQSQSHSNSHSSPNSIDHSFGRLRANSELPLFMRQPSRDGDAPEFGNGDGNLKGPRVTTPSMLL